MQRALLALRIVFTVCVLAAVLATADLAALGRLLGAAHVGFFAAAVGALLLQGLVLSVRFRAIVGSLGPPIDAMRAVELTFVGLLFNQVLPSAVGGDAVRAWQLRAAGRGWREAVVAVLLDRGSGVLVLAALAAVAVALEPGWTFAPLRGVLFAVAAAGIAATALLAAVDRLALLPPRVRKLLASNSLPAGARVLFATRLVLPAVAWSVVSHLLAALAAYWLAAALHAEVAIGPFVAAALCMLLATMIPLSYAGWGIREAGAVWLFAQLAIPAESALAISMLFGVALFVAALPGAAFWLAPSRERGNAAVS
ncbi:MAG TPA: lysylphosphatidylglycerol synthase transmembrane domain-containing protein [Gammaproteobacteria bacterium]